MVVSANLYVGFNLLGALIACGDYPRCKPASWWQDGLNIVAFPVGTYGMGLFGEFWFIAPITNAALWGAAAYAAAWALLKVIYRE